MNSPEHSRQVIFDFLDSQQEWLLRNEFGKAFSLDKTEIEIEVSGNKLLFSFLDNKGFQIWRVTNYEIKDGKLNLGLTRNFKKENEIITLIPRISAGEIGETVELARLEKANKYAQLTADYMPKTKLVRVSLNKENGRIAKIILENPKGEQTVVLADVSETLTPEILLSTAILKLTKLQSRKKKPVHTIWILAEKKQAKKLQHLHALLRENWKSEIGIFEIDRAEPKSKTRSNLIKLPGLRISDLWSGKAREIKLTENPQISRAAGEITRISPENIDVVFNKNGETLRFLGLPFARVRKTLNEEKTWFGIEKERRVLTENNLGDLFELVENLKNFRSFDSPNPRHALYCLAPEAWLESILRRNIKLLDANLILSPLYHQFRAEKERVDLLALRRDGRLVIIELKTEPDREMIFQAAGYWRKIELLRRKGSLQKARLFGELKIADKPAVCYLVAPTLSFHRDFSFFAGTISEEIEFHRFNLAENWRENLKVLSRQ